MSNSSLSLDSLSSPSPSPEPVDPNVATAIDSGSELSELTDDDADAMSNGQDQDQDNDDQDQPEYDPHDDERAGVRSPDRGLGRKRGRIVPPPMWDWYSTKKPDDKTSIEVEEEEEEEETEGPPKAMEEEEDEEDDDNAQGDHDVDDSMQPATSMGDPIGAPASKGDLYDRGDVPGRRHKRARPRNAFYNDDVTDDDAQTRSKLPRRRSFAKQRPTELKDGEVSSDGEGNDTPSEDEKEREVNDAAQNLISISKTRSRSNTTSKPSIYNKTTHDIPLSPVKSVPSASIMGGASLLRTISRSLSPASLASGSPATSRSASPLGDEDEAEQREDDAITPGAAAELASALKGASPSLPAGLDAVASSSLPGDDDLELDADHEGPDDQEQEQDLEMEMELESDLQPAHRAEALDVLAAIELKFALLRERVYVEKMEALAWEEALVAEGIHPEMLYLQAELLKRRDKRLELAARKREREILNIVARRKVDEDATWSWWKFARDELQMDMIAETNRKRRRLERERRALEKPQPFRRIPHPPREVPHPPTLRQIIKSFPFGPSHRRHERERDKDISSWVYPDLPPLAPTEVVSDLEYMFQHRRNAFDPHRGPSANPPMGIGVGLGMGMGMPMPMAAAPVGLGPPMPPNGYEASYGVDAASMGVNLPMGMGMNATPTFGPISNGRTGMPPPPPPPPAPYQHQHQPQPHAIPLPPHNFPTRSHPPPLQPPPPTHHSHAAFGIEPDLGGPAAPAPLGQHTYFGSVGATGYVGGRRSISPVLVNGPGKQGGAWPSAKGGGNEWRGEHSHLGELDEDGRERRESRREHDWERERERDKRLERDARARELHDLERERDRERSFHLHMQPQSQAPPHRVPPPPSHQHVHGPPVTHHHPPSHHHHHHHHHVVHHHHPQPVGGGSHSLPLTGPGPVPGRDFETVRASRIEPHPTEIINLSLAKAPGASSSAALPSPWKAEDSPPQPSAEYRAKHRASTSSQDDRDRERPLAMPFVMPATSHGRPSQVNGQQQPAGQSSLPIWMNGAAEESSAFRPASSGYLDSHDGHVYAPVRPHQQGHSRHGSLGLSPPRARASGPDAPSPGYPGPLRSPSRYSGHPNSPTLKMHPIRAVSPPPSGKIGPGSYSSPRLTGPGRTATPLGVDMNGAGTGMHLSSQLPSPRLSLARVGQPESTSKALSPLGPPKLNVPQVVEGS